MYLLVEIKYAHFTSTKMFLKKRVGACCRLYDIVRYDSAKATRIASDIASKQTRKLP